ncbi:MAG: nicotinate-nucleotide--dimethylbenzimidazole phosphoribosyltransferase [Roseburia sp.]
MTREELEQMKIKPVSKEKLKAGKEKWDSIAKPLDGLGDFETMVTRIGAILGSTDFSIEKRAVIVMCADNGVVEEGVSQSTKEVTAIVSENMGKGITSVCRMATAVGADVIPVDIGVDTKEPIPGIRQERIRCGTCNFRKEPAMTEEEALRAIETGIRIVKECKEKGYQLLATGEMGIGNTTTSSAVAAALIGCPVTAITGKGAGLSKEGLTKKYQVIEEALERYHFAPTETLRILATVGGLDIAGLAGVFIGGAYYGIPVIIDGVISSVAALAAERLVPGTKEYMLPSHQSKEPAAKLILEELGVKPVLDANLALGEGTGAVLLFPLLDTVMAVYRNETTFADIKVEQYERFLEQ